MYIFLRPILLSLALTFVLVLPSWAGQALTVQQLLNTTYPVPNLSGEKPDTMIDVVDGRYEHQGTDPRDFQELLIRTPSLGRLTVGSSGDAAVSMVDSGSGSGAFVYLVAVQNQNGKPVPVAKVGLGDRTLVNSIRIHNRRITVDMLVRGEYPDGACCTSVHRVVTFRLVGNKLVGPRVP